MRFPALGVMVFWRKNLEGVPLCEFVDQAQQFITTFLENVLQNDSDGPVIKVGGLCCGHDKL